MPKPRRKKPNHLEVTGVAPLPPEIEAWERALIEPVLARLFAATKPFAADTKEVHDGEAR